MVHPFSDLFERSVKPSRVVAGIMSGTSADSIDVAICRFQNLNARVGVSLLHYSEHDHDGDVKRLIRRVAELNVRALAELHVALGEAFAAAFLRTLSDAAMNPDEVDLIGSHGQTVYHHSGVPGAPKATLQLGDGDIIAVRTGRFVISDFRARDVAAGGEGAPLSPIADTILFGTEREPGQSRRAILNLGGIANITVLDDDPAQVFGFDVGPANAPIDRLARILSDGRLSCDEEGRIALSGAVNRSVLAELLERDDFVKRPPPKSTGFEMYGDVFVAMVSRLHGRNDADLMATLTEFAAQTVARGLEQCAQLGKPVSDVVVAGGGVNNPALFSRIAAAIAPVSLRRSDQCGVPAQAREAMAFAILADMTLRGVPAPLPSVTGAAAPKLLGKLSFP
jgi:anhydro-N-acetylmuramic acid kinase